LAHGNGPFLAGFLETADDFVDVEALELPVFFANHQLDGFEVFIGSVALTAVDAFFASSRSILWGIARFKRF
jgi:hypothetical protein